MADSTQISQAKGKPMLQWVGKRPLTKVEYFPAQEKEIYGKPAKAGWLNKLFWGDNLQVLSHLLKDYRGKIDLVYIDPPFDSKADYIKRVQVRGEIILGQQQGVLEEKQYSDIWEKDEYLQFMYERLLITKELLSDKGSIYLHCDWHKAAHLRLIMDEVFGEENFINEIIWYYPDYIQGNATNSFAKKNDIILFYSKTRDYSFKRISETLDKPVMRNKVVWDKDEKKIKVARGEDGKIIYQEFTEKFLDTVWTIGQTAVTRVTSGERTGYPTQKPEALLRRVIEASTEEGDLVLDFFVGSGTTAAVAQKHNRRWIGCDINIGAIQTTTKRLSKTLENLGNETGFKVYNVNDYDIFKNELEAKEIVMQIYGVEPIKLSYFDGTLDNKFVKVMPLNRVLNKHDILQVIKTAKEKIDLFDVKKNAGSQDDFYEQGVIVICSGAEPDILDTLKNENKTGVKIEVRDLLADKENLVFKQTPEASITAKTDGNRLILAVEEFFSPLLMRKLSLENERSQGEKSKVSDFKQLIDSVAVDVDYNGELFNAEIMDVPDKKALVAGNYEWQYDKPGKYTIAVKITDVLGEEYFETLPVTV